MGTVTSVGAIEVEAEVEVEAEAEAEVGTLVVAIALNPSCRPDHSCRSQWHS